MDLQSLLDSVLVIAKDTGKRVLEIYQQGDFHRSVKADLTPVTSADLEAHQLLVDSLSKLTPTIPVLSEEDAQISLAQRQDWIYYWLVDPLDGTQEFISGTGDFTTTIALIYNNQPVLGVVYYPIKDTSYFAIKGVGAWKKEQNTQSQPLHVLAHEKEDHLLSVTIGHRQNKEKVINCFEDDWDCQIVLLGSASLKSCLVAEGGADCYLRLGLTGEWDTAAIQCIVEEAGGSILDLNWQPLTYNQRESLINPDFIVMGDKTLPWKDIVKPTP